MCSQNHDCSDIWLEALQNSTMDYEFCMVSVVGDRLSREESALRCCG